jgi:hypothetical protein
MTDKDITNFHDIDWLPGGLLCTPTTLEFPIMDRANIVCFELHLMCGLGHPLNKFLVDVLNYLGCELVHLHLNAIITLSCFNMLCEYWLGILPGTTSF